MIIALLAPFGIYLFLLLLIGFYSYSRVRSSSDFLLGGRNISYWVTAISAHASDMSSWLFFGLPAAVYFGGVQECWIAIGLLCGMWATWHFIAPQLRVASEAAKSMTLPHFIAHSAGAKSRTLIIISSALLVFFFVFYLAAGLRGIGIVLEFAFGIPALTGTVVSALVVMLYTMLGGYVAVALTDAFQGLFLLAMIIMVPIVTWFSLPSFTLTALPLHTYFFLPDFSYHSIFTAVMTAIGWGLGYLGMPHVLTKFMSIDSAKNMKKAQYTGLSWQFLALGSAIAIGLLARHYFTVPPTSGEQLFMVLVSQHFTLFVAGFIFCAILAATISTLDAQLIVCASVITGDLYQPKDAKTQLRITRLSIAALTGIALLIVTYATGSIHTIVRYAWSGLGASFAPLVVMSLYRKKQLTEQRAIIGMIVGGLTAALWPLYSPWISYAPLVPSFLMSLLAMHLY